MGTLRNRFLGLCLPPLLFAAIDGTLTLAGQSAEYREGTYSPVNEASPTFHHLLGIHPLAYVAGLLVWMGIYVGVILLLPGTLALIVSIAVTLGHSAGAATWLLWRFQYGYQACNGLFLLTAVALGLGIRWGWQAGPPPEHPLPFLSGSLRWVIAAALFAIGVYLFMWPRTL